MNTNEIRQLIYNAAETVPNGTEFDARMIEEILFEQFDEVISINSIRQHLPKMNFSQRKLDKQETAIWRSQYDSRPKTVYSRHLGKDSKNYERGIGIRKTRPLLSKIQEKELDTEECAKCPEFEECQGNLRPCPRFPVLTTAPKDRVLRLEDFE